MVFSSQIFLFFFLPAVLASYFLIRRTVFRNAYIFLVSLIFYFWSGGAYIVLLLFSVAFNYFYARVVDRYRDRLWPIATGVMVNLALLGYFKYAGFFARNVDPGLQFGMTQFLNGVVLPIGISFFTFQAISYLIDVHRRELAVEPSFFRFGAYLTFFPQLIAGPIVRYQTVHEDFTSPRPFHDSFAPGVRRFTHGLVKKLLIADGVGMLADAAFSTPSDSVSFLTAGLGTLAYTLQIYFDFSGYSDMAIGLGMMFGIKFDENFMRPYSARSITEFWRRWHISLSSWFRDYLYIPLGGNRHGQFATYRNLVIVFLATGFWHGASWTFVIWGIYHGVFMIFERLLGQARGLSFNARWLRYLYLLPVVAVGWIIFRAQDMAQAWAFITALVQPFAEGSLALGPELAMAVSPYPLIALAIGSLIFLASGKASIGMKVLEKPLSTTGQVIQFAYLAAALLCCLVVALSASYSPFLYFQF